MSYISPYKVGKWLSSDQHHLDSFIQKIAEIADEINQPLHPVIEEFKTLIETDAEIYMYFNLMFTQVPHKPPYNNNPNNRPQVRNYHQMLRMMNIIMTRAPEFLEIDGQPSGLIGFPINAILDWPMATPAGYAAFLNDKVNAQLKKILDYWGQFLKSPESAYVLNDSPSGWFGRNAFQPNALGNFSKDFKYEPDQPHFGYNSWDDFFTREFKSGRRPVASPKDDNVIVNACESAPYRYRANVQKRDQFWIKGQCYSMQHMMANNELMEQFIGGTVYQAFLSALSYHRWHSPVTGTVVKTKVLNGSYYSEPLSEGFANPNGPDPSAPNNSQGYITEVATRALIYIQSDNPLIGLMCFMAVGMSEVSTCDITVKEGQHIQKGEQTGMFHFGGSTHCLIFRPETLLEFDFHGQTPSLDSSNIPLNSKIATVRKRVS